VGFFVFDRGETVSNMSEELFAAFLKLNGRPCLVVGAGKVAESKIESLVRCGAEVRVVAPEATEAVRAAARAGKIVWERRAFEPSDLTGVFLVVAATPSRGLHEQIFAQAQREGILCNAVDQPERCDFYYPAVVRRGPLQIAVSTSGRAPLLAQQIRKQLEAQFGPEYGPWTEQIGRARSQILAVQASSEERLSRLQELCSARPGKSGLLEQTVVARLFRGGDFLGAEKAPRLETRAPGQAPENAGGKVYFLGAGPGDPDLLTRKAWKLLQSAEVVLHDALVSPDILQLIGAQAEIISAGKRCGKHSVTQEQIHEQLIAHARAGRRVVRLQGGDPLVFGRAGEEMSALRAAGIEFEIVPGVTSASAAAAAAQVALTDRKLASKLIFLSAHRCKGDFAADWATVAKRDATLAIYMPGGNYDRIASELRRAGLPAATPCVIVSQASTPRQLILRLELGALADLPEPPAPALLLVGEVTRAEAAEAADTWGAGGETFADEVAG
jgi:uroporphyrin-III C-methyltransferase/precorrin-2 dehydrogenase/sirohydrochlorin ferrochelatase